MYIFCPALKKTDSLLMGTVPCLAHPLTPKEKNCSLSARMQPWLFSKADHIYIGISEEYCIYNICNYYIYNVCKWHVYCSLSVCGNYIPRPSRCPKPWIISNVCVHRERLYTHISIKIVSRCILLSTHEYMWVIFIYIHICTLFFFVSPLVRTYPVHVFYLTWLNAFPS